MAKVDKELELYRNLLEKPTEFKDGFSWASVLGVLFCGLVMMPGSIYLGLMTGGGLGAAAQWVTVILFAEIYRRSMKSLTKQELVILLHAAAVMMGAQIGGPVFRAFLVTSDAVRDAGMSNALPDWFVPAPDSPAILDRNLFHRDWWKPIGIILLLHLISTVKRYTLGYFFFRLTSDVEKLPFPMAPIAAQGAMALAEMDDAPALTDDKKDGDAKKATSGDLDDSSTPADAAMAALSEDADDEAKPEGNMKAPVQKQKSPRWRIFSLGAAIGIAFGMLQVGVPAITGLFLDQPVFIIPQPFFDTSTMTEGILPATATGINIDIGIILIGFVIPFWAVVGSFIAIIVTMVANPIMHHMGILTNWQPGMDTVNTTFANEIDFWMSFGIGTGLGIAVVSLYSTLRDMQKKLRLIKEAKGSREERGAMWDVPKGRGDYPLWVAIALYCVAATSLVILCKVLIPQFPLYFLILFSFVYNPFISYVNARLLGISGQQVDIPFLKQTSFILSGAKGVDIWLAPIPIENFGGMAQSYRVNELTGVSFWSLIKVDAITMPAGFILSLLFWAFIWHSGPIPSNAYPNAQIFWELQSKRDVLLWSSTFVPEGADPNSVDIRDSEFWKAIHPSYIAGGLVFTVVGFAALSGFGMPVLLIYGVIRGLGNLPHVMILEIVGALIGRYYLQKIFGQQAFLRAAPILLAGYFTGVGLISMATIAMQLISQAVSSSPF